MFNEFKSLELFRHQVASRVDKSIKRYADKSKTNADIIGGTVTSAFISLLVVYLGHGYVNQNNPWMAVLLLVFSLIVYIVAYFAYKGILKIVRNIYYNTKRHKDAMDQDAIKELIDNFDHIACDNNLVAKGFMSAFDNLGGNDDQDIKEFYYYEVLYYTEVAASITQEIVDQEDHCINTLDYKKHVDLHRIINQLDLIEKACTFLNDNIDDKCLVEDINLKSIIIHRILGIEEQTKSIRKKCVDFKSSYFSDSKVDAIPKLVEIKNNIKQKGN